MQIGKKFAQASYFRFIQSQAAQRVTSTYFPIVSQRLPAGALVRPISGISYWDCNTNTCLLGFSRPWWIWKSTVRAHGNASLTGTNAVRYEGAVWGWMVSQPFTHAAFVQRMERSLHVDSKTASLTVKCTCSLAEYTQCATLGCLHVANWFIPKGCLKQMIPSGSPPTQLQRYWFSARCQAGWRAAQSPCRVPFTKC